MSADPFLREGGVEEDEVDRFKMSVLDHIRELRQRLIIVLSVELVAVIACFTYAADIFGWLVAPMNKVLAERGEGTMAITDPLEGAMTWMKVAILAGTILASPVILYQLWAFVAPGLYSKEKKVVIPLFITSTLLFVAGAAFGYYVMFEYGFRFLIGMVDPAQFSAVLSINSYLGTAAKLLLAFGASFQMPVVVWFLARLGLVDAKDMIQGFRFAVVSIFVLAAFLTPGTDPVSQLLLAVPLIILYIVSIGVAFFASTKVREPAT